MANLLNFCSAKYDNNYDQVQVFPDQVRDGTTNKFGKPEQVFLQKAMSM